jgi:hypothetical protein
VSVDGQGRETDGSPRVRVERCHVAWGGKASGLWAQSQGVGLRGEGGRMQAAGPSEYKFPPPLGMAYGTVASHSSI